MLLENFTISVIIPAFNSEKFISRAIKSVESQTFAPYEIIVVDDGSTDNTFMHVQNIHPEVILIKQENSGAAHARNTGIATAMGEWITFLDADDIWFPEILMDYRRVLLQRDNLLWCCAPYVIQYSSKTIQIKYKGKFLRENYISNLLLAYSDFNYRVTSELVSTCSVIINKKVFENIGVFNEKLHRGEDIDLWFRIALNYPMIGYANVDSFKYLRINENSLTSVNRSKESIQEFVHTINKTWAHSESFSEIKSNEASYVLNIWCFRLLKLVTKKRQFKALNNLSVSVYSKLNARNKLGVLLLNKLNFISL